MKVVRADISDLEAIASLFDQYRQFYQQSPNLDGARDFLRERFQKQDSVIFYAETAAGTVGFTQLYPSYSSIAMKKLWILNDLYVTPAARRSSVGRSLLQQAMDFAAADGAGALTLKTAFDNEKAQALYESLDWKQDKTYCNYNFKIARP